MLQDNLLFLLLEIVSALKNFICQCLVVLEQSVRVIVLNVVRPSWGLSIFVKRLGFKVWYCD